jgi:hypothetical protein
MSEQIGPGIERARTAEAQAINVLASPYSHLPSNYGWSFGHLIGWWRSGGL